MPILFQKAVLDVRPGVLHPLAVITYDMHNSSSLTGSFEHREAAGLLCDLFLTVMAHYGALDVSQDGDRQKAGFDFADHNADKLADAASTFQNSFEALKLTHPIFNQYPIRLFVFQGTWIYELSMDQWKGRTLSEKLKREKDYTEENRVTLDKEIFDHLSDNQRRRFSEDTAKNGEIVFRSDLSDGHYCTFARNWVGQPGSGRLRKVDGRKSKVRRFVIKTVHFDTATQVITSILRKLSSEGIVDAFTTFALLGSAEILIVASQPSLDMTDIESLLRNEVSANVRDNGFVKIREGETWLGDQFSDQFYFNVDRGRRFEVSRGRLSKSVVRLQFKDTEESHIKREILDTCTRHAKFVFWIHFAEIENGWIDCVIAFLFPCGYASYLKKISSELEFVVHEEFSGNKETFQVYDIISHGNKVPEISS